MGWRTDSSSGAALWDTEPLGDEDLLGRDEELRWLMAKGRTQWGLINGRLARKGEPVANVGAYSSLNAYPPAGTLANVASLSGEAALWNSAIFSPWLADALLAPSAWRLFVSFQATTSTSPASLTINPRIGSLAAGASSTGGVQLGADAAITLTASITTNWKVEGNLTVQSIGIPGNNSKAIGDFTVVAKPATTGVGAATINDTFGFTQGSFDATLAQGVVLGMANTVTTITYAVLQIHWLSL